MADGWLMASTTTMITSGGTDRAGHIPDPGFIGGRILPIDFGGLRPLTQALDPPGPMPKLAAPTQLARAGMSEDRFPVGRDPVRHDKWSRGDHRSDDETRADGLRWRMRNDGFDS